MPRAPHPMKGIPRKDWAATRVRLDAEKANVFAPAADAVVGVLSPQGPQAQIEPAAAAPTPIAAPKGQAPPRNLFSGQMKSLDVFGLNGSLDDPIPGYRLYWFTDEGNSGIRINQATQSGWELVNKDEIALQDNLVPGNNDLGTHVRKVVNPHSVPPTYGYLMKKPVELDALHQAEIQAVNDKHEWAMKQGLYGAKPEDARYTAGPGSSLPKIEISSKNYR